ncbi:MAG: pyridoxal phosphate-dependent class II aminotransferase [Desulfobacterales bacterium]|nr:pyridoxal phosphate-dependent class II aminotransferase [Desulfobacterales bacterium]
MINGHGGNIFDLAQKLGCAPSDIIDMSSNVNPLGPPPKLLNFLVEKISSVTTLPEVEAKKAISAFAGRYSVDPKVVLAGNGTTQFIYSLPLALKTENALIIGPTYADYEDACKMHNISYNCFILKEQAGFKPDMHLAEQSIKKADTVFICNPNNPTGVLIPAEELNILCKSHPNTSFVIDESYLPFVADGERHSMINSELSNVIVLNSMSKIFRIPGLRIGFIKSSEKIIEKLAGYSLPWSVNSLAQAAVVYLMEHKSETDAFIDNTRKFLDAEKKRFADMLENASGIKLFPSTTSFMLARLTGNHRADEICYALSCDKILIRNCANFKGLSDRFIRISLKTQEINTVVAEKILKFQKS